MASRGFLAGFQLFIRFFAIDNNKNSGQNGKEKKTVEDKR